MPEHKHITVKLPQLAEYIGVIKPGDKIYVWDSETGTLKHANVEQLPFGSGGGSGHALVGSPFMVKVGDEQVTVGGGNTVVEDARLMGKTDYPVISSQLNTLFRPAELTYDSVNGRVTITGFELQAGEVIALHPDGVAGSGSGSMQPILDRLAALEAMTAPFKPTGSGENRGRVWWTGPTADIPTGWVVDTDWNGRVPVGLSASEEEFNTMGKTGGAKGVKLAGNQQGKLVLSLRTGWSTGTSTVKQFRGFRMKPEGLGLWAIDIESQSYAEGTWTPEQACGVGEAEYEHPNIQPYRVGCWIKYVGA